MEQPPMGIEQNRLFLGAARYYSLYRPHYPAPLFDLLTELYQLSSSTTVVDVGVGTGQLAIPLAQRAMPVVGIDPQPEMLAEAESAAMRASVHERVRLVLGRGEDLRLHVG